MIRPLFMMIISYLALLFGYYVKKKHRGSYAYFAKSGNCPFSLSTKWVIDSGASDHMTDLKTKKIISRGRKCDGLYVFEPELLKSLVELSSSSLFKDTQPNITKLDPKSLKYVFLRYFCIQKEYRCYSPQLHRYLVSRDVTFHEDLSYFPVTTYRHQEENDNFAPSEAYGESVAPSDAPNGSDSPPPSLAPELDLPIALRKVKRTCRYLVFAFGSYDGLSTSSHAFVVNLDSILVPKTLGEALAYFGWRAAMIEEMNALDHNSTWAFVDLPVHKKEIGCKWVFSVKMNPDGSIARLKARLVAKGYAQTYGIDYSETLSPNAFLHGDLEEEVYIEQPPRFVAQGGYGRVCKLKKALYGLKQSLHAWFRKFSNAVIEFGLRRSVYDHSIFYSSSNAGFILLVVYVDDIVITGSNKVGLKKLKSFIGICFQTKGLGSLKYFLGIKVFRSSKTSIYIATNPVFNERTKHIEVDRHFNREKLEDGTITTPHIRTEIQLADVLTKALPRTRINSICNKLGMINIYAQLKGEC
nr:retrovirus-related Pol polyprotein from transposon TNT 1-94 [Tanacetum cinerariifolium]